VSRETGQEPMKLVGITVLTSLDEEKLQENLGVSRSLPEQVVALAKLAQTAGLAGVVSSPQESKILRENLGQEFLIITPGIRPQGSQTQDQLRVLTPREAIQAGSSYLVVGRPITQAPSPREALEGLWG
ncbi:MAG: orotidine-5'-phosphate decarboxylase, partial [Desulfitobacterium sp.]|nr:orotidine-5'-phosphate decarboxylase [Desulfitobacterium sp.]